jgi:ligand-binding SRPBCC domain-containing protein
MPGAPELNRPRADPGQASVRTQHVEHVLRREQLLPGTPSDVFEFYADAGNLELITPAWLGFRVVTSQPIEMRPGALIEYRLTLHRVPVRWLTRIEEWEPGQRFVDVQVKGPYRFWHHTHTFEARNGGTIVRDEVRYTLPLGPLGELAHRLFVRRDLECIFDFRHASVSKVMTE